MWLCERESFSFIWISSSSYLWVTYMLQTFVHSYTMPPRLECFFLSSSNIASGIVHGFFLLQISFTRSLLNSSGWFLFESYYHSAAMHFSSRCHDMAKDSQRELNAREIHRFDLTHRVSSSTSFWWILCLDSCSDWVEVFSTWSAVS